MESTGLWDINGSEGWIYVAFKNRSDEVYNDSIQDANKACAEGEYFEQDAAEKKEVCQFKRSVLRQCSGLADSTFGYSEGQPCILVKMNRVIGLRPRGDPHITCAAKRETPLQMQYFPTEGKLDKSYFPYYGKTLHANYVQPVVAVKLLLAEDDYNSELVIECKVEGTDLLNNDERDKFLGRVTFRVKVPVICTALDNRSINTQGQEQKRRHDQVSGECVDKLAFPQQVTSDLSLIWSPSQIVLETSSAHLQNISKMFSAYILAPIGIIKTVGHVDSIVKFVMRFNAFKKNRFKRFVCESDRRRFEITINNKFS
ncbi:Sodium/potassium-transporting ATPase subunit beta-3 [Anabarilius grahami]|uniref:Sodium/potassium-transporting ATPase subunit beta-3 n=1 Tax=Anabarilius grahami TaxID=495550 RepID=A0A3N0XI64_ANAGA|nr:Sodium/potassium-transporting ATPase subunit beta-3 [Anabarilius grahami]